MKFNLNMLRANADGRPRPLRPRLYLKSPIADQHADYRLICHKTEAKS